jgi:hypothetical protein
VPLGDAAHDGQADAVALVGRVQRAQLVLGLVAQRQRARDRLIAISVRPVAPSGKIAA